MEIESNSNFQNPIVTTGEIDILKDNFENIQNSKTGEHSVRIRDLCMHYKNGPTVLQEFSMSVEKGTIYSLLGSSGCGKTTVLSCIVGLLSWNSGQIMVLGRKPNLSNGHQIGYMPQDAALYTHLRIPEIVHFYGLMYNMKRTKVKANWMSLQKLLDLPDSSKRIKDLSGGMKRRASLALALIHSPPLLVLDEPTVELDPLLRQSIWNYLQTMAKHSGTTILITTHYTDEARLSDKIGVIRNGKLIAEEAPVKILERFGCFTLDDAVMKLCRENQLKYKNKAAISNDNKIEQVFQSKWKSKINTQGLEDQIHGRYRHSVDAEMGLDLPLDAIQSNTRKSQFYKSFKTVYGFTTVMVLTFLRFPALVALMLIMPTIQGSLTIIAFGSKMKELHIGVVDNELPMTNWNTICDLPEHFTNSCDFSALSCKFLNELKSGEFFILDSYETEKEARTQVHLGNSWGYLTFPQNYSEHQVNKMVARHYTVSDDFQGSLVHVHLDNSQFVANYFMIKELYETYYKYVQNLIVSCKIGTSQSVVQMHYHEPVYGTNDHDVTYVLPGVIVCSIELLVSCITSFIFIADLNQGTLARARVAGLSIFEIMLSHVITQGIMTVSQIFIWNIVTHFVFGIEIRGSFIVYMVLCLSCGLVGALIGLVCGIIFRDEVTVLLFGIFLFPTVLMYGGVFFPFESMPWICQFVAKFMPTTLPTEALRSIVIRGVSVSHPRVWLGLLANALWTVVLAALFPLI